MTNIPNQEERSLDFDSFLSGDTKVKPDDTPKIKPNGVADQIIIMEEDICD